MNAKEEKLQRYHLILIMVACTLLGFGAGAVVTRTDGTAAVEDVQAPQTEELSGWELLTMAIIKTESDFNSLAVGRDNDTGVLQITGPYVAEVNRILDTARYVHADAFSVAKSVEMFNIYQEAKNPEHDVERAIYLHNPKGSAIGYEAKVLANFRWICRYEEIRQQVRENGFYSIKPNHYANK